MNFMNFSSGSVSPKYFDMKIRNEPLSGLFTSMYMVFNIIEYQVPWSSIALVNYLRVDSISHASVLYYLEKER